MKKYILFTVVLSLLAFSAYNQNTPTNPSGDSEGGNGGSGDTMSYPYLTLNDITPLQLLSLNDAEAKLTQMGFAGGYTGSVNVYEKYIYSKKADGQPTVKDKGKPLSVQNKTCFCIGIA